MKPLPPFPFNPLCPCIESPQMQVTAIPTPGSSFPCTVAFPWWRKTTSTGLASLHSWGVQWKSICRTGQLWHELHHGQKSSLSSFAPGLVKGLCSTLTFTATVYIAERIQVLPSQTLGCILLWFYYRYINERCWKACRFDEVFFEFFHFSVPLKTPENQLCPSS